MQKRLLNTDDNAFSTSIARLYTYKWYTGNHVTLRRKQHQCIVNDDDHSDDNDEDDDDDDDENMVEHWVKSNVNYYNNYCY